MKKVRNVQFCWGKLSQRNELNEQSFLGINSTCTIYMASNIEVPAISCLLEIVIIIVRASMSHLAQVAPVAPCSVTNGISMN